MARVRHSHSGHSPTSTLPTTIQEAARSAFQVSTRQAGGQPTRFNRLAQRTLALFSPAASLFRQPISRIWRRSSQPPASGVPQRSAETPVRPEASQLLRLSQFGRYGCDFLDKTVGTLATFGGYALAASVIGILDVTPELAEGALAGYASVAALQKVRSDPEKMNTNPASDSTFSNRYTPWHSIGINAAKISPRGGALLGMTLTTVRPFVAATIRSFATLYGIEARLALTIQTFKSAEDEVLALIKKNDFDILKSIQRSGHSRLLAQLQAHRRIIDRELLSRLDTIAEDTNLNENERSKKYANIVRRWHAAYPQVYWSAKKYNEFAPDQLEYWPRISTIYKGGYKPGEHTQRTPDHVLSAISAPDDMVFEAPEAEAESSSAQSSQAQEFVTDFSNNRRAFNDLELTAYAILRRIDGTVYRRLAELNLLHADEHFQGEKRLVLLKDSDAKDAFDKLCNTLDIIWRRATLRSTSEVAVDVLRRKVRLITAEPDTTPPYAFFGNATRVRVVQVQDSQASAGVTQPV